MLARVLLTVCVMLAVTLPALAQKPSFAELLARAQAQAAAGHRWTPPGDNMTETVVGMMDLIPTATAEELSELSALLDNGKTIPDGPTEELKAAAQPTRVAPAVTAPPASVRADTPPRAARPADTATPSAADLSSAGASRSPASPSDKTTANKTAAIPGGPIPLGQIPLGPLPLGPDLTPATPLRAAPPAESKTAAVNPTLMVPDMTKPVPARPVTSTAAPSAARPGLRAIELFVRGEQAERQGDVSAARRFYASAIQLGHAAAARSLGRLYDPAYLKQAALGGIDPDPAIARRYYEQAIAMGDAEAGPLLEALSLR